MRLADLISGLPIRQESGPRSVRITDVTEDSRTALPGSLFIARKGLHEDGSRFVDDAVRAGAAAILATEDAAITVPDSVAFLRTSDPTSVGAKLAERHFGSPSSRLYLMGVTGTNGKTTVAHCFHRLLNASSVRCGLIGTIEIDDGSARCPATMTTPTAVELGHALANMVEAGCLAAALETSSHALSQSRTAGLSIDCGIFTNLTPEHLDYHTSMDAYAQAKAILFENLPETALAVINADDPAGARMAAATRARVLMCSARDPGAGASVEIRSFDTEGMDAVFRGPWGELAGRISLVGAHNAMNVLQAVAAAHDAGLTLAQLRLAITLLESPPGRLERVDVGTSGPIVLVDYAHTPDAFERVIPAVRELVPRGGQLWIVFGCGGDRDPSKRAPMGRTAAQLADHVVVTADNPRTERPNDIITEILSGVTDDCRDKVHIHPDRTAAIEHALSSAGANDLVLLAGKGHEQGQILPDGRGGVRTEQWDDRTVARRILASLSRSTETAGQP